MAKAVVGESGNDVKMGVGDDLAGGAVVVHYYIYSVGVDSFFDSIGQFFNKWRHFGQDFVWQFIKIFIMSFGDN